MLPDSRLDIPKMLEDFTAFWLENGEWLAKGTGYNEAGAQLVFVTSRCDLVRERIDGTIGV